MSKYILECNNISKQFLKKNKISTILKNVNFKVKEKEIVIISGKSGEGKSVLLWLLSAIDQPTSGEVLIDNINILKLNNKKIAKYYQEKVAFIFQDYNLIQTLTALENIQLTLIHSKLSEKEKKLKAIKMLKDVDLIEKKDFFPFELSIGQRQKIAIARGLINNPRIIFADEPTGGLDADTAALIIKLLCKLVKKNKSSLIVATHGVFPLDIGDSIYLLKNSFLNQIK